MKRHRLVQISVFFKENKLCSFKAHSFSFQNIDQKNISIFSSNTDNLTI